MNLQYRKVLYVYLLSVVIGTCGSAMASDPQQASVPGMIPAAGPDRPANVPDDYVVTPFGYFHASCVQSLAKGERVLRDGRIQHADGATNKTAMVCRYPHYARTGIYAHPQSLTRSPEIDGWVENDNVTTGSPTKSYGAMFAVWEVPSSPPRNDGQVLYFFPGLEDINNTQSILQPVMQWYQGQWAMASWNCCMNGVVSNSPFVSISTGDEIYGSITSTCPAGTLLCATWNVLSLDMSTGESTTLSDTPSEGQIFNWAFGGVLEAYYIQSCEDYPKARRIDFQFIRLFDQSLHPIANPKWGKSVDLATTPLCNYRVSPTPNTVTLDF